MRRTAQKSKKVVVPKDILGNNISNEMPIEKAKILDIADVKEENLKNDDPPAEPIELIEDVADDGSKLQEVSFYEKVTGEKPPEMTNEEGEGTHMPQIENLNKRIFFLGGVVFLLTIALTTIIGLFILNASIEKKQSKIEDNPQEEIIPTPVPVAAVDKSKWSFEVLNGSGEGGKAKKTADTIETLGYTIESTGNADKNDYTGITVSFISEIKNTEKELVLKDLEKEFLSKPDEKQLNSTTDADIVVIIGK